MTAVKKSNRGRKDKLTPEVQASIIRYLRAGNYCDTAAVCSGINEGTFWAWMKRGEEEGPGSKFHDFAEAVKRAEGEAEAEAVAQVRLASRTQWAAGMTWLERKFPSKWRRRDTTEHTGGVEVIITRESNKGDE